MATAHMQVTLIPQPEKYRPWTTGNQYYKYTINDHIFFKPTIQGLSTTIKTDVPVFFVINAEEQGHPQCISFIP